MNQPTTDEILEMMLEYDEPYCECGAIHDEEEIASMKCSACGKIVD